MTSATTTTAVPVPKMYWDALEGALQAQVKRLARDISTCLREPEVPFLKHLAKEKVSVYLFEEEGSEMADISTMRCSSYVPCVDNPQVLVRCNQPILLGRATRGCPSHAGRASQTSTTDLRVFKMVRDHEQTYWVDDENTLYTVDLVPCGYYKPARRQCVKLTKI